MRGAVILPETIPGERIDEQTVPPYDRGDPSIVILYNCDCHNFDEVIHQVQIATGCGQASAEQIAEEAHRRGRAIAYTGETRECERAAGILRSIGLQVETDAF